MTEQSRDCAMAAWRQHGNKWHAWLPKAEASVCGYVEAYRGGNPADWDGNDACAARDDRPEVPAGGRACSWCLRCVTTGATPPMPQPQRPSVPEVKKMLVEFIGGRHDGARLTLDVVEVGPTRLRVLGSDYEKRFRPGTVVEATRPAPTQRPWE